MNQSPIYANPYDSHLGYRQNVIDISPRFYIRTRWILKLLPSNPKRILDVGCGDGAFLSLLESEGISADGIDGSAKAIELCKERFRGNPNRYTCCFIEEFYPQSPYDLIICGDVIEHIHDDQPFLNQINRLCAVQGRLVLSTPVDMALWGQADVKAGHYRRYSKDELFMKLGKAGFEVEDHVIWGYPLTRLLMPLIRKQQNRLMVKHHSIDGKIGRSNGKLGWKRCLGYLKYILLLDNLFNFTERGVSIVVRARKVQSLYH